MFNIHTHTAAHNAIYNASINTIPDKYFFSIGIHPKDSSDIGAIIPLIQRTNCIAIGECGLDNLVETPMTVQIQNFNAQIELANNYQKAIIIHVVKAHSELISILKKSENKMPVIIHGFNNNSNILQNYLNNDYYISLGKALLQDKSNAQQALLRTPLEKIFFETDTADIEIGDIYRQAAILLNTSIESIIQQVNLNANKVFIKLHL